MAEFFFNMMLSVMFIVGLGSWALGKLLGPKGKRTLANGVVGLITRYLRM